jgi:hypothetical protein
MRTMQIKELKAYLTHTPIETKYCQLTPKEEYSYKSPLYIEHNQTMYLLWESSGRLLADYDVLTGILKLDEIEYRMASTSSMLQYVLSWGLRNQSRLQGRIICQVTFIMFYI